MKLWWDNRSHLTIKMLSSLIVEFEKAKQDSNMALAGMAQPGYTESGESIDQKVQAFHKEMDYRIGVLKDLQDLRANQK